MESNGENQHIICGLALGHVLGIRIVSTGLKILCLFLHTEYINHIHLHNFLPLSSPFTYDLLLALLDFHNIAVFVLVYISHMRENMQLLAF
jgi:hypothetical protein